jgi:hypothetical protein
LAQISFWAVYESGLLSKAEAMKTLRGAIAANKTGGPGNRIAAAQLEIVLKEIAASEETRRH